MVALGVVGLAHASMDYVSLAALEKALAPAEAGKGWVIGTGRG